MVLSILMFAKLEKLLHLMYKYLVFFLFEMCKNTRRGQYCARKRSQQLSKSCQGKPNKSLLLFLAHRAFYRCKLNIWKTLICVLIATTMIVLLREQDVFDFETKVHFQLQRYVDIAIKIIIIIIIVLFFNYIKFCLRRNHKRAKIKINPHAKIILPFF